MTQAQTVGPELRPSQKRIITLILFFGFFMVSSNVFLVATIYKFIKTDLALPVQNMTILLAAYPFIAFFTNVLSGPYIDKFGRRRMIIIGSFFSAIVFLLTSFSSNSFTIIFFRGLAGFCVPLVGGSVFACVVDYFSVLNERMKIMGYVMSSIYASQIVAIPLSILAAGYISWRFVFYGLSFISFLLFLATVFLLPPSTAPLRTEKIGLRTYKNIFLSFVKERNSRVALFVYLIVTTGFMVFFGLYPTWIIQTFVNESVTISYVSVFFLLGGIVGWLGSYSSGKMAAKSKNRVHLFAILALGGAFLVMTLPGCRSYFYVQLAVYLLLNYSVSIRIPVFHTILMQLVKPMERGSLNAFTNALFQTGTVVGFSLSSFLFYLDDSYYSNVFAVSVFFIISGVLALFFVKEKVVS